MARSVDVDSLGRRAGFDLGRAADFVRAAILAFDGAKQSLGFPPVKRWLLCLSIVVAIAGFPRRCPAPIIYRPGEGWTYESVGSGGKWVRNRAKDQLAVAQESFDKKDFRTALKAARRTVKIWPLSDYAGPAQYLLGRVYEARRVDEKAFKEYQRALTRYPKLVNYDEVLQRQTAIALRFLGGQWFKLWGVIPIPRKDMDKTAQQFDQIYKNGPYHETGSAALMNVGTAREKEKNFPAAVKAYERAADKYWDRPEIAADAMYRAGMAWQKQAKQAGYDQGAAGSAVDTLNDFKALHPSDRRVDQATETILTLRGEQAKGAFQTAQFYERYRLWSAARVYYNESLARQPDGPFSAEAKARLEFLKPRAEAQTQKYADFERKSREASKTKFEKSQEPKK